MAFPVTGGKQLSRICEAEIGIQERGEKGAVALLFFFFDKSEGFDGFSLVTEEQLGTFDGLFIYLFFCVVLGTEARALPMLGQVPYLQASFLTQLDGLFSQDDLKYF